jgi:hypothetical protein
MSYRKSALVSPNVQRGTITITASGGSPSSNFATLAIAVVPAYSCVRWVGQAASDSNNRVSEFVTLVLTDATTVTATVFGNVTGVYTVQYEVLSWHPSVIISRQTFQITMSDGGSASASATLSTAVVLANAVIFLGGYAANGAVSSGGAVSSVQQYVTLSDTTHVTATRLSVSGSGCIVNGTVIEFK